MLPITDLRAIARERLHDARALIHAKRFDGAAYLTGYAVEMALKARICRTLGWQGFPEKGDEFKGLQSLKTHDLEVLLRFSGIERRIRTAHLAQWSVITNWDPEKRYSRSPYTEQMARDMVAAAKDLVNRL